MVLCIFKTWIYVWFLGGSGPSGGVKVDELSDEELQAAVDEAKTQVRRMQLETQMFQGICQL